MAKYTTNLAASGTVKIADVHRPHSQLEYVITIMVTGSLGGGVLTVQISPDQGITLANLGSGSTIPTYTTGQAYTFRTGAGHALADMPTIYVTLTGATAPTTQIIAWDNN